MRTITACALTWCTAMSLCLAVGNPVSERKTDNERDTTTYKRDGKKILTITLYRPNQPEKQILRQIIWQGETKIAEVVDSHDKHSYLVMPDVPVTVGIEHSATGGMESVILMDDALGMVECFRVEDGRLKPISGRDLAQAREITQDVQGLFDAVQKQEDTPEEIGARAAGIVLKHKLKQAAQQAESTVPSKAAPSASPDVR